MIEPEAAFFELEDNMNLAEEMIKYLVKDVVENCADEIEFFEKFVDKELRARLNFVLERPFSRVSYTEAVKILQACGKKFEYPVKYGVNFQSEHERYLTDEVYKGPVVVINYPKAIKSFYMRQNEGCAPGRETVAAMDVLLPRVGEIIGGSQREERIEHLQLGLKPLHVGVAGGLDHHTTLRGVLQRIEGPEQRAGLEDQHPIVAVPGGVLPELAAQLIEPLPLAAELALQPALQGRQRMVVERRLRGRQIRHPRQGRGWVGQSDRRPGWSQPTSSEPAGIPHHGPRPAPPPAPG